MRYAMTTAVLSVLVSAAPQAQDPATAMKQGVERQVLASKVQDRRVSVETRQTKNAPYSAEAVTESVQVLADGNRIVTKTATRIYRDGDGRTRREQLSSAGTDVLSINISDPVAGNSYVLDPSSHRAFRNGMIFAGAVGTFTTTTDGPGEAGTMVATRMADGAVTIVGGEIAHKREAEGQGDREAKVVAETKARVAAVGGSAGSGGVTTFAYSTAYPRIAEAVGKTTREELGEQIIEGVKATGTRSTIEIAVGAIGNEQPIKVVSEQWYSSDLQVLVLTKHLDPRVGETTYRLTGIVRAEPAHSLFELPADYTLKESVIRRDQR